MPTTNISKKVAAERPPVVDLATGLLDYEKNEIKQAIGIAEAEKRIEAEAIPENVKKMILQRIKVDDFTILERYVELTPSMCDVQDCGYDAAKEMGRENGISDWYGLPVDFVLGDGKTVGQRAIELKEYHKATKHTYASLTGHIISETELRRRQEQSHVFTEGYLTAGAR